MNKKYEEYLNNPYKVMGIEEKFYTVKADETLTVNPDTGEYFTMRKVAKDKKVLNDGLVYVKLFQDNMSQLMSLSHSSLKVLLYAMCTVRPLQQTVVLNIPDISIACDIANSTVYNAIYELLDKKILCKKLGSNIEFWFDPNIFFNGNRLRLVK